MDQAFYHFWLAERQDLADIPTSGPAELVTYANGATGQLGTTPSRSAPTTRFSTCRSPSRAGPLRNAYTGPKLKGEYSVLTLFTRTGQVVVNETPPF